MNITAYLFCLLLSLSLIIGAPADNNSNPTEVTSGTWGPISTTQNFAPRVMGPFIPVNLIQEMLGNVFGGGALGALALMK
ncbi:hypothetical protein K502DRAFT_349202 [Neoconidiobolus thromboides FSU 785]|nr:hypothetical protein K502DRAFT_349202 [Neoconidiobolus thromboides FSU 785]